MPTKRDYDHHRKTTVNGRKQQKGWKCELCKKGFEGKNAPAISAEIETNNFRGDDIVHFYHPGCWAELPDAITAVK